MSNKAKIAAKIKAELAQVDVSLIKYASQELKDAYQQGQKITTTSDNAMASNNSPFEVLYHKFIVTYKRFQQAQTDLEPFFAWADLNTLYEELKLEYNQCHKENKVRFKPKMDKAQELLKNSYKALPQMESITIMDKYLHFTDVANAYNQAYQNFDEATAKKLYNELTEFLRKERQALKECKERLNQFNGSLKKHKKLQKFAKDLDFELSFFESDLSKHEHHMDKLPPVSTLKIPDVPKSQSVIHFYGNSNDFTNEKAPIPFFSYFKPVLEKHPTLILEVTCNTSRGYDELLDRYPEDTFTDVLSTSPPQGRTAQDLMQLRFNHIKKVLNKCQVADNRVVMKEGTINAGDLNNSNATFQFIVK